MAWVYLILAGLCEVGWIVTLKLHNGFSKLIPSLIALAFILASPFFASLAMKSLGIGTGYAVWIGVNCVLLTLLSIFYFNEPITWQKIACISLIIAGAVGLKLLEVDPIKS